MSSTRSERDKELEALYRKEESKRLQEKYNIGSDQCWDIQYTRLGDCFNPGFFQSIKYKLIGEEKGRMECFKKAHADYDKCLAKLKAE